MTSSLNSSLVTTGHSHYAYNLSSMKNGSPERLITLDPRGRSDACAFQGQLAESHAAYCVPAALAPGGLGCTCEVCCPEVIIPGRGRGDTSSTIPTIPKDPASGNTSGAHTVLRRPDHSNARPCGFSQWARHRSAPPHRTRA